MLFSKGTIRCDKKKNRRKYVPKRVILLLIYDRKIFLGLQKCYV